MWALTWFEQQGFAEDEYGVAEQLSKSKNTSVAGMVEAGILESKRAAEALAYNGLVQSWPEIMRLSREEIRPETEQGGLFE